MREAATARMQEHWALRELIGYIRSWSATARYTKQNGVDPAAVLEQGLEHEWGDPTSARKITWPLSLRIGVNPRSWFRSSLQQVILAPMSIEPLARFRGRIECRSDGCGPLGLILSGYTEGRPRELVHLAFAGMAPEDFPQFLESPTVERLDTESYAIASAARRWTVNARAAHLHREVAAAFFEAVPARPIRWTQRLFWRMVLALAATAAGRRLLRKMRGA